MLIVIIFLIFITLIFTSSPPFILVSFKQFPQTCPTVTSPYTHTSHVKIFQLLLFSYLLSFERLALDYLRFPR